MNEHIMSILVTINGVPIERHHQTQLKFHLLYIIS